MTTNTTIGGNGATVSQTLFDTMNGTNSSTSSTKSTGNSATDLQNTFLQLLIAQMKNQDPTSPMDSSQMTSQLAEINTVTGIGQLNTSLTSLSTQLTAGQQTQAANLCSTEYFSYYPDDTTAQLTTAESLANAWTFFAP